MKSKSFKQTDNSPLIMDERSKVVRDTINMRAMADQVQEKSYKIIIYIEEVQKKF